MALSNVSGFPRIGARRELKFATEGYWRGDVSEADLLETAKGIRLDNWRLMQQAGIDLIPSNDFSLYDHVLDTIALVGAVPERYGRVGGNVDLDTYFAMARGRQEGGIDVTAMEMTKWFDTNYHYIVPELGPRDQVLPVSDEAVRRAHRGVGGARRGHRAGDPGARCPSCCSARRLMALPTTSTG